MDSATALKVRVTRYIDAPPERLFNAWLDPKLLGTWMFGKNVRDEEIVRLEVDPRVGGQFSFVVRRQGQEFNHIGSYLEIAPARRLVFTWGVANSDTSQVEVEFLAQGPGCEVVVTHELHPNWVDFAAKTQSGWAMMLEALSKAI